MHLQTTATEITQTGYSTKKFSNQLIILCILWDTCHELFCVFGDFYVRDAGYRGNNIIATSHKVCII